MDKDIPKLIQEISQKINILIALKLEEKEKMKLQEKVKFLLNSGLTNQQMAEILGASKGTIEVIKSRLKKKSSKK